MVGLSRRGGRQDNIVEMFANPTESTKKLAEQFQQVQAEREKLEKVLRDYGGIEAIDRLKAEAEQTLVRARAEAANIVRAADAGLTRRETEAAEQEQKNAQAGADLQKRIKGSNKALDTRKALLDTKDGELKSRADELTRAEQTAASKTREAAAVQTEAQALLEKLTAIQDYLAAQL